MGLEARSPSGLPDLSLSCCSCKRSTPFHRFGPDVAALSAIAKDRSTTPAFKMSPSRQDAPRRRHCLPSESERYSISRRPVRRQSIHFQISLGVRPSFACCPDKCSYHSLSLVWPRRHRHSQWKGSLCTLLRRSERCRLSRPRVNFANLAIHVRFSATKLVETLDSLFETIFCVKIAHFDFTEVQ